MGLKRVKSRGWSNVEGLMSNVEFVPKEERFSDGTALTLWVAGDWYTARAFIVRNDPRENGP